MIECQVMNDNLSTWMSKELKKRDWSMRKLARRMGVSATTVTDIVNGVARPSVNMCNKIANELGVSPQHVMRLAGMLPPLPSDPEKRAQLEWLEQMERLTPEERMRVIEYARFVEQQRLSAMPDTA